MVRLFICFCLSCVFVNGSAQSEAFWSPADIGAGVLNPQRSLISNGVAPGHAPATFVQTGNGNQLTQRNWGVANTTTSRQIGDDNQLEVNLIGSGNQYRLDQLGNRNVLSMPEVRSNQAALQIIQRGDDNQLIREASPSPGVSMRIEQTGGMRLHIANVP